MYRLLQSGIEFTAAASPINVFGMHTYYSLYITQYMHLYILKYATLITLKVFCPLLATAGSYGASTAGPWARPRRGWASARTGATCRDTGHSGNLYTVILLKWL